MFLEVVEVHAYANFHQAKCSCSWVIVFTVKPNRNSATMPKTILPSLPRAVMTQRRMNTARRCQTGQISGLAEVELFGWRDWRASRAQPPTTGHTRTSSCSSSSSCVDCDSSCWSAGRQPRQCRVLSTGQRRRPTSQQTLLDTSSELEQSLWIRSELDVAGNHHSGFSAPRMSEPLTLEVHWMHNDHIRPHPDLDRVRRLCIQPDPDPWSFSFWIKLFRGRQMPCLSCGRGVCVHTPEWLCVSVPV